MLAQCGWSVHARCSASRTRGRCAATHATSHVTYSCPYATLGLRPDASEDEIRKAYRKMAKLSHPDVKKDDGLQFVGIADAYHFLLQQLNIRTDANGQQRTGNSAAFNDWYYSFRMRRSSQRQTARTTGVQDAEEAAAAPGSGPNMPTPQSEEGLRSQLAGLRQRAAIRKNRSCSPASQEAGATASLDEGSPLEDLYVEAEGPSDSAPVCGSPLTDSPPTNGAGMELPEPPSGSAQTSKQRMSAGRSAPAPFSHSINVSGGTDSETETDDPSHFPPPTAPINSTAAAAGTGPSTQHSHGPVFRASSLASHPRAQHHGTDRGVDSMTQVYTMHKTSAEVGQQTLHAVHEAEPDGASGHQPGIGPAAWARSVGLGKAASQGGQEAGGQAEGGTTAPAKGAEEQGEDAGGAWAAPRRRFLASGEVREGVRAQLSGLRRRASIKQQFDKEVLPV